MVLNNLQVCALIFWNEWLVSSSLDGTVRLWNNDTDDDKWQCMRALPTLPGAYADSLCVVNRYDIISVN